MRNQPWHLIILALVFIVAGPVGAAHAFSSYLTSFGTTYPAASASIKSCTLCHPNNNTAQLTSYATAYLNSGYNFSTIAPLDSDADGYSNLAEITAGTFPGDAASKPAATDTTPPTVSISAPVTGTVKTNAVNLNYAVSGGTVKVSVDGVVKTLVSGNVISGLSNGLHTVRVESTDAANNVGSKEVSFTVDVEPMFVASIADNNGNAIPEVAALLRDYATGGYAAFVKDTSTKVLIRKINFGTTYLPRGLTAVADMNANGKQELAMLGKSAAGNVAVIIKDSGTGATLKTLTFASSYEPVALAQVPDVNGNGSNELAMIAVNGAGQVVVVVKDIASGAVIKTVNFPSTLQPVALAVVADVSGNSAPELAVLSAAAGQTNVVVKDALTGAAVKTIAFSATVTPLALVAVPDVNGNGADELAVIVASASGQSTAILKDSFTGLAVKNLVISAKTSVPQTVTLIGDINGNAAAELGALGLSAAGAVSITVRDTATGLYVDAIPFTARQMGTTPEPPVNGKALYDASCADCHSVNGYDASGSPDLAAKGGLVAGKFTASHNGITLTATQKTAVATFLNQYSAPAPPVNGQTLYDASCAGCHSVNGYDASGAPDLAARGSSIAAKFAASHNGITLTAAQQTAMATFLDQYTAPPIVSCTSCHGQPPAGTTSPNRAGAHQVHSALAGVGSNCNVCHGSAPSHNGQIDRGIVSTFNAKSGAATANANQTCSSVSCHGGKVTPNWLTGTINVNTQCTSCHQSGTTQYNSYNSGRHTKHASEACTDCHSTAKLATGHFANLATSTMEGPASATIGGSGTQVTTYNTSTRSCATSCHGSKTW